MKILFVASSQVEGGSLRLEREITELQRQFQSAPGDAVQFSVFPDLSIEELPTQVFLNRPDILHISTHGDDDLLVFRNCNGGRIDVTAEILSSFLRYSGRPRLIYVNACKSDVIATKLCDTVPMAIGTTVALNNLSARAGAVAFYDRLMWGHSVADAFEVSRSIIEVMNPKSGIGCKLVHAAGIITGSERFHCVPSVVARFVHQDEAVAAADSWECVVGVAACPKNTCQLVFFTDASDQLEDRDVGRSSHIETQQASRTCLVVRGAPIRGSMWSACPQTMNSDVTFHAAGLTPSGSTFVASSTLSTALENYYSDSKTTKVLDELPAILNKLRSRME